MIKNMTKPFIFIVIIALASCALKGPSGIKNRLLFSEKLKERVIERNSSVEDTPEWIEGATRALSVQHLKEAEPEKLRGHFYCNGVFVFVHPGYHVFIERQTKRPESLKMTKNLVEYFLSVPETFSIKSAIMKSYEAEISSAIELLSEAGFVIILILPEENKDIKEIEWAEYRRYINEITNNSPYVFYLYSETIQTGKLHPEDYKIFTDFVEKTGIKRIFLGGQYYNRCVYTFYKYLPRNLKRIVRIIAEWSAPEPEDITAEETISLRGHDGWIDSDSAYKLLRKRRIGKIRGGRKVIRAREICKE
ncbi:MAG: hypothetical protein D6778_02990 [Nitrospirae bacterium]|nr:MAG: hypothetical protein D6778_02990 [Nitrospirota bacterium]